MGFFLSLDRSQTSPRVHAGSPPPRAALHRAAKRGGRVGRMGPGFRAEGPGARASWAALQNPGCKRLPTASRSVPAAHLSRLRTGAGGSDLRPDTSRDTGHKPRQRRPPQPTAPLTSCLVRRAQDPPCRLLGAGARELLPARPQPLPARSRLGGSDRAQLSACAAGARLPGSSSRPRATFPGPLSPRAPGIDRPCCAG